MWSHKSTGTVPGPEQTNQRSALNRLFKNGFVFVTDLEKTDIKKPDPISVSGKKPGKEKYSGGGTLKNKAQKDFYDKEVKRLGGVQQYRDHYKIGKKTTTPGSSSSISSNPK